MLQSYDPWSHSRTLLLLELPNPYHDPKNSDLAQWLTTFFNGVFNLNLIVSDVREQYDNFDELFQYLFGLAVRQGEINEASFEVNTYCNQGLVNVDSQLLLRKLKSQKTLSRFLYVIFIL